MLSSNRSRSSTNLGRIGSDDRFDFPCSEIVRELPGIDNSISICIRKEFSGPKSSIFENATFLFGITSLVSFSRTSFFSITYVLDFKFFNEIHE